MRLLQTLEDRETEIGKVEEEGPYICRKTHAWLTSGYYFWDTHIELGHWWGEQIYGLGRYIICEAQCQFDSLCWDLHGNGEHRIEFKEACDMVVNSGIARKEQIQVPTVIQYLRENNLFKYKAVRALGVLSMSRSSDYYFSIPFPASNKRSQAPFLELYPAVQICLFDKQALSLQGFRAVYPEHYREDYV